MFDKRITITDVARLAGVSISTVSRVINNSTPVSDDLRARVQRAMDELGYQPNVMAQNLRRHSLPNIGVILPTLEVPFFADVVRGIEEICFRYDRTVLLCNADSDPEREVIYAEELSRLRVDGIIFAGAWGWEHQDHIVDLYKSGMPLCFINRELRELPVDMVLVDRATGDYDATRHLLDLGHRAIACIVGIPYGGTARFEVEGYRRALKEAGVEVDESLIVQTHLSLTGGYEAAKELLARKERPTAVFAHSDNLAQGVMHAAWELGVKVPEHLSVVGFDDSPVAKHLTPPLTTIRQPHYEKGVKAATLLFDRIANPNLPQRQVIMQPRLIVRESTAPARNVLN